MVDSVALYLGYGLLGLVAVAAYGYILCHVLAKFVDALKLSRQVFYGLIGYWYGKNENPKIEHIIREYLRNLSDWELAKYKIERIAQEAQQDDK